MNKLFAILIALLLAAPSVFAQEKPAAAVSDTKLVQNQLNAPAPAATDIRPSEGATATTMPQVGGKIAVPAELASAKGTSVSMSLPAELKGRWSSPNGQYGQIWSIKKVGDQWLMTWWKVSNQGCSVEDAPVTIKNDATSLEISLNHYKCMNEFYVKLEKNGAEFKGGGETNTILGGAKFSAFLR